MLFGGFVRCLRLLVLPIQLFIFLAVHLLRLLQHHQPVLQHLILFHELICFQLAGIVCVDLLFESRSVRNTFKCNAK